jgi:cystathionine beta-lyase/cystathionine gamma-synthase
MSASYRGLDTKLIHAGEAEPRVLGAVAMPIFQSATFEGSLPGTGYIRLSNTPNQSALHAKLAALESGEAALVTTSGMAAITTTLLTVLSTGDHLLAQRGLYGGTHGLLTHEFRALGIAVDWIDADDRLSWKGKLRETTRAVYVETMTNPLFEVGDLVAVSEFAAANGLVSIIDNTFATPVNFRPLEIGFDLSLHSCTKYMNGHDDIAAGAVIGGALWVERIHRRSSHFGAALDPHAAFLLQRGMKTLGVRVRHQNCSALRIARFLEEHPEVTRVQYPGLESHPRHQRACGLFDGFGGTLSFELRGGVSAAERLLAEVELVTAAPSLGGVHSLIMRPPLISHAGLTREERAACGITDGLIRLSVGLEATEDLIEDLERGLRMA